MAYMHIITELPCLHNFRQECATGLCSEFRISQHFLLRCDVLLVLETIGSEINPIWIEDDDDDEWCPLNLRQFGMLRSFIQTTGE